jgi:hypothetical protein
MLSKWMQQSRREKLARLLRTALVDPFGVARALPGELRQRHGRDQSYFVQEAWYERLHELMDATWPCPETHRADELVEATRALLAAKGLGYGRQTYGCYSDGDISLCRAAWCIILHTKPDVVVETGVAHGVTSRIILEALQHNHEGHLWSIDLPNPLDRQLHAQTGAAVPDSCRARWSYVEGSSRRRLPRLVGGLSHVGLFIHDSLHTSRNTLFEMSKVAAALKPGGTMLVDDILTHEGFAIFSKRHPEYRTMVCPSADGIGAFGIAVKAPSA